MKDEVAKTLHKEIERIAPEIVSTVQELVRIPSITGDEAKVGAVVAARCAAMGFKVEILESQPGRPNVLATWDTGVPGPTLLLNDHLDIVPPGPLEYWTHPPFAAEIADGCIYGRGTIDTKSGLTTLLMATRAIRDLGIPLRGKLVLLFTCDEEVGGKHGIQHVAAQGRLKADLALVAEPTTMQVEIATKARLTVEITTRGVATHGARPWLGQNAIEDMMIIMLRLQQEAKRLEGRRDALLGFATINIGIIEGGTVPNMVPNKCRLEVDRRCLPDETREGVYAEFGAILAELKALHPKLDASLRELIWWPGYKLDPDETVIGHLCAAYEDVIGTQPRIAGKDAGTDASWIHSLGGIPVVMFSPGNGLRAMNADENVNIDDLVKATQVVGQFVLRVLG